MNKVIKISLILLITICITGNVYAALKCNIGMKTEKNEFSKEEEFTVDVTVSNIESDRGVISFGGTLEYDKDSLNLIKMEGLNGWETPGIGTSYNESNGKFAITRSGLGKNDETILKLTFKVKNTSKQNLMITLKNMTLADGTSPAKVSAINKNITIKEGTQNPIPEPGKDDDNNNSKPGNDSSNTDNSSKPGNDSSNTDSSSKPGDSSNINNDSESNNKPNNSVSNTTSTGDNSSSDKTIPQTGDNNYIILILLGITVIVAIALLIKIKRINTKK